MPENAGVGDGCYWNDGKKPLQDDAAMTGPVRRKQNILYLPGQAPWRKVDSNEKIGMAQHCNDQAKSAYSRPQTICAER